MARIPSSAIKIALSVVILLGLMIGGGVLYVWYTGQTTEIPTTTVQEPARPSVDITPTKPAANANASASVQMLTSPVAPGENVSMSIKTVPTSICTIKVEYDSVPSTDSGLVAKTADEFGIVNWTWTVAAAAPDGTWPAVVTCSYNGRTAVVQGDVMVAR